jgi:geranylgeranyl reductase family protein
MRADVAIVGAGPAGALAAYRLASRGARVTLIDGSHPREKPCGGGITGRALALVDDVIGRAQLPACVVREARFIDSRTGRTANVPLRAAGVSSRSALIVASRAAFDAKLVERAQAAGVEWVAARARDVVITADGVRVETARDARVARFLIGADGATSLVRRRFAGAFRRDQLSIGAGYFAHGVTSDAIAIELIADPPGYVWSFPRPGHLAIGVCAPADSGAGSDRLRRTTADWIRTSAIAEGARLEPYSWPIPSLSSADLQTLALGGERWCLVGDAAGLVDPITREVIFFALSSAEQAADALMTARAAKTYTERVNDLVTPELVRAAHLKRLFFDRRFIHLLMRALTDSAAIREVTADLVAGRQTYKELAWRLVRTREIGLLCRLLMVQSKLTSQKM